MVELLKARWVGRIGCAQRSAKMNSISRFAVVASFFSLYGCEEGSSGSSKPATGLVENKRIEFTTVPNSKVPDDVEGALVAIGKHYSPVEVTFAREDLNGDGLAEILVKVSDYGFFPNYTIAHSADDRTYEQIGGASGDQLYAIPRKGGWAHIEGRAKGSDREIIYSFLFKDGVYDLEVPIKSNEPSFSSE